MNGLIVMKYAIKASARPYDKKIDLYDWHIEARQWNKEGVVTKWAVTNGAMNLNTQTLEPDYEPTNSSRGDASITTHLDDVSKKIIIKKSGKVIYELPFKYIQPYAVERVLYAEHDPTKIVID